MAIAKILQIGGCDLSAPLSLNLWSRRSSSLLGLGKFQTEQTTRKPMTLSLSSAP
jgi:hypothetical protein